jgi:hypothetical protein
MQIVLLVCRRLPDYYTLIYTHCLDLMKLVGSNISYLLPFMTKLMVRYCASERYDRSHSYHGCFGLIGTYIVVTI